MGWWRSLALVVVLGVGLLATAASAPRVTVLMVLGDSVAAGRGASRPAASFAALEAGRLRDELQPGGARLDSYAVGGATSGGMLRWQAPLAAAELAALHRGERPGLRPGPVVVTVGGNDLLALLGAAVLSGRPPDEPAVRAAVREVEENLEATVALLVEAGGPRTPITLMTYYDPFVGQPETSPTRRLSRLGTAALNEAIARVAARHASQVRLARVDLLLPADPAIRDFLADAIHPNDRGHAVIAWAVATAAPVPAGPAG